jgi:transposase InsO family protein
MHCHPNARRTPRGRAEVFRLVEAGMTVTAACLAANVSRRFYYRWRPAWRSGGEAALVDRSSRPHTSPRRLTADTEQRIVGLRAATGFGPDRLATFVDLPASTVHRVLRRHGLLPRPRPRLEVVRYEHDQPGGLLHVDTKKLGRIVGGPGHRITGDRHGQREGVGWDVLHVAIDDATRLVYAELLADERGRTAARFLVRAVRWFRGQGVLVRRVITDNGAAYRSRAFGRAVRWAIGRRTFTRPYRPQTNGKVERWIRTVLSESLYVEVFTSSAERELALRRFVRYYNDERPHLALGGQTPRVRLAVKLAA